MTFDVARRRRSEKYTRSFHPDVPSDRWNRANVFRFILAFRELCREPGNPPIPGGLPKIISGSTPANLPISLPGRLPGSLPGGIPKSFPGNLPATFPGSLPGSLPGSFPGSPPDSGRHSGKLSDKPSEKGSGKQHRKSPDHHWDTTGTPPVLRLSLP